MGTQYGCRIYKDFKRPDPALVERFKGMPVANIDDNMQRIAAVDSAIKPVGYKGQMVGVAFTVRVAQGDNLMLHAAMDLAKPGDIIVIDAGGFENRAIFGELMCTYLKTRGVRGIICDGAIRDYGGLAAMEGFNVYARAATPNGPYKNGPGEINVPVVCGGKVVYPGDIVVADDDGVLFVRPEDAEALIAATLAVEEKKSGIMKHILEDGTNIQQVTTTGAKDNETFLLNKSADLLIGNVSDVLTGMNNGTLKVLCVFAPERVSLIPDIPTCSELGFGEIVGGSDRGYALPMGVDPAVREVLYNALVEAINDPATIQALEDIGAETNFVPQEDYAAFFEEGIAVAKAAYGVE